MKITRSRNKAGYIVLYLYGETGKIERRMYEHRYVMEAVLGRALTRKEVVHHINGDRADNRPENLELHPSNGAHLREHFKGCARPAHVAEAAREYMLSLPFEERRIRGVKGGSNSGPGLKKTLAKLTPEQRRARVEKAILARKRKAVERRLAREESSGD